jgi:bisphosphoglycerate-dependent phosphoglycerate mutase
MFMKDIPAEYTELLRDLNAHDVPFFERNIYGHLEGVYRVLKSWRAPSVRIVVASLESL